MLSRQNGTRVEALVPFYFMLTLLAESKTMSTAQSPVSAIDFENNKPLMEETADSIMGRLENLSPIEIAAALDISQQLAVKAHNLAFDFPHKATGLYSLYGFTGEAFRGLEASTLSPEAIDRANSDLKIISSVYGILNTHDIIKPYRFEFNKAVTPEKKTSIQIFKPKVTIALANYIKQNQCKEIIDLLPADADKCIDWKLLRAFVKVYKVCFKVVQHDGTLKTPLAKRLKELRGMMARCILMENIQTFDQLSSFKHPQFVFSPEESKPGMPVFISD